MKDFGTVYIIANTPVICENIIKDFLRNGTPFSAAIEKRLDYEREYHYCPVDILRASVNSKLYNVLHNQNEFVKFLNKQRKEIVRPAYKTVQDYVYYNYEFPGAVHDLFKLLQTAPK